MRESDDRADTLYGLPLEQFVPERDALAKALRSGGDRAAADEVRKLPKPTRAAWAVNMAVREQPEAARALADSARLLGDAQRELLAGGDASALREASERAHAAIDALAAAAPASGDATAAKVRETLQAATADPDVLAEVVAGRVLRERVASGFGGLPASAGGATSRPKSTSGSSSTSTSGSRAAPARRGASRSQARPGRKAPAVKTRSKASTGKTAKKDDGERARAQEEKRARAAAEREAARRQEALRRAKEAEAEAEQDAEGARRALEQTESALAERRVELREAQARLKDARRRRERAER